MQKLYLVFAILGFLFGYLYRARRIRLEAWVPQFTGLARRTGIRRNRKLKIYHPEEKPRENITEQVDQILAKISEHGEASLTKQEREVLNAASRRFRNR